MPLCKVNTKYCFYCYLQLKKHFEKLNNNIFYWKTKLKKCSGRLYYRVISLKISFCFSREKYEHLSEMLEKNKILFALLMLIIKASQKKMLWIIMIVISAEKQKVIHHIVIYFIPLLVCYYKEYSQTNI